MSFLNLFKSFGFRKSASELENLDARLLADIGVLASSVRVTPLRSPFEVGTDRV